MCPQQWVQNQVRPINPLFHPCSEGAMVTPSHTPPWLINQCFLLCHVFMQVYFSRVYLQGNVNMKYKGLVGVSAEDCTVIYINVMPEFTLWQFCSILVQSIVFNVWIFLASTCSKSSAEPVIITCWKNSLLHAFSPPNVLLMFYFITPAGKITCFMHFTPNVLLMFYAITTRWKNSLPHAFSPLMYRWCSMSTVILINPFFQKPYHSLLFFLTLCDA